MNTRKMLIGAVLVIIGLPVVLVPIAGGSFYALLSLYAPNRTKQFFREHRLPRK